jgi:hypothetical protein
VNNFGCEFHIDNKLKDYCIACKDVAFGSMIDFTLAGNRQPPAGDVIYKPLAYIPTKRRSFLSSGKMPHLIITSQRLAIARTIRI